MNNQPRGEGGGKIKGVQGGRIKQHSMSSVFTPWSGSGRCSDLNGTPSIGTTISIYMLD